MLLFPLLVPVIELGFLWQEALFGEDLYGDDYGVEDEEEQYGADVDGEGQISRQVGSSAVDIWVPESDDRAKELQQKLMEALAVADKWRSAFKEVATVCGFSVQPGREPDIASVVESARRTRTSEQALQDESKQLRRTEASLNIQLAERNLEVVELRRDLSNAWAAADPNVVQLKQLLLDPALNKEFSRLKSELEATQAELKNTQEELAATSFTQESKVGRQLMAKCRSLADENEDMGRELAEGKAHMLETQLAMAKDFASEVQAGFLELQDHCKLLDDESEELQHEVFVLRRQIRPREGDMGGGLKPHGGGPMMGRGMGGGFRGRGGRGFGGPGMGSQRMGPPPMMGGGPDRFMGPKRIRT
eukprot:gene17957-24361_t